MPCFHCNLFTATVKLLRRLTLPPDFDKDTQVYRGPAGDREEVPSESLEGNGIMAKILLLDFEPKDLDDLRGKGFDAGLKVTNWKTLKADSLVLDKDCRIIFYQVLHDNPASQVHSDGSATVESLVERGGYVTCFIGPSAPFHLTNVIGTIPELEYRDNSTPGAVVPAQDNPLDLLFRSFNKHILHAFELFPVHYATHWEIDLRRAERAFKVRVLAQSADGLPIAILVQRGQGGYLLLPWFGDKNYEAALLILREILPVLAPHLFTEQGHWLENAAYQFPELARLIKKREEVKLEYDEILRRLDLKIQEAKTKGQEMFRRLLVAGGAELKAAVMETMNYLGWQSVDVNEYWKRVIRSKEEDLWLFERSDLKVEEKLGKEPVLLINIRSGPGGAADEDAMLLQRYKGRRMQEFGNTRMKSVLIGNYFSGQDAGLRPSPFSGRMAEESQKDGNALLTTAEIFRAVKAQKEGKLLVEDIRKQMAERTGVVAFEF